jgi:hypothetical protein
VAAAAAAVSRFHFHDDVEQKRVGHHAASELHWRAVFYWLRGGADFMYADVGSFTHGNYR